MKPGAELPDDPALPGLAAIRAMGVARALPALGLADRPVELVLCGYTPGDRATLEVRGPLHLAIKAYAEDPAPEVELYQALAARGLAGESGARVPPILAWERDLRLLVLGWLEGPTAHRLVKEGQGGRAGELAAAWFHRAASLPVALGPPCDTGFALYHAGRSVAALAAADPPLGATAKGLVGRLARVQPRTGMCRLAHGTLYARHVLDLGDGPGVIDWQRFGQGPLEVDAGTFLATTWRLGLDHEGLAGEARRAEQALIAGTTGLFDEAALAWYRAAALVRLAGKVQVVARRKAHWQARANALLTEAGRLADVAALTTRSARPPAAANAPMVEWVLEFALGALSSRPATPEELEQIRRLLDDVRSRR